MTIFTYPKFGIANKVLGMNRRKFIKTGMFSSLFPVSWTLSDSMIFGDGLESKHSFIFILLDGGVDYTMILPTFKRGTTSQLSDKIDFYSREVFEAHSIPFIHNSNLLYPGHPLLERHGHDLTIIHGVDMDNAASHPQALGTLIRGENILTRPSIASVMGDLLAGGEQFSSVSYGNTPQHSSESLIEDKFGLDLPKDLNALEEVFIDKKFNDLDLSQLASVSADYYHSSSSDSLKFSQEIDSTRRFRKFFVESDYAYYLDLKNNLILSSQDVEAYKQIEHRFSSHRHYPLASISKLLNQGVLSSSFIVSLGDYPEGIDSYDSHGVNIKRPNWIQQQELLRTDLQALEIFLTSIEKVKDSCTIFVGTEFSRTPKLNSASGKDHWPANNTYLVWSPLFRPGIIGEVDEEYVGQKVMKHDGSVSKIRTKDIYSAMINRIVEEDLFTCSLDMRDKIFRNFVDLNNSLFIG